MLTTMFDKLVHGLGIDVLKVFAEKRNRVLLNESRARSLEGDDRRWLLPDAELLRRRTSGAMLRIDFVAWCKYLLESLEEIQHCMGGPRFGEYGPRSWWLSLGCTI